MSTNIITAASLLIALAAVCLTLWQNVLQRRAAQAQVFLHMLDQFGNNDVSKGSVIISRLGTYTSLDDFDAAETVETQEQVYRLVEFLNDTARLVWSGYLPRQRVWDLYFMVYRTAFKNLLPWWLEGQRQRSYQEKFIAFEEMCMQIAEISLERSKKFDAKQYPRYSRRYLRSPAAIAPDDR